MRPGQSHTDTQTDDVGECQPCDGSSTLFVTGIIRAPHQADLEYEVITMAAGLSPSPRSFFENGLEKYNSNLTRFSQWCYNSARAQGCCVYANQERNEYMWAWRIDDPVLGNPLAITTAIRPNESNLNRESALPSNSIHSSSEPIGYWQTQNPQRPLNQATPTLSGRRDTPPPNRPSIQVSPPTPRDPILVDTADLRSAQASPPVLTPIGAVEQNYSGFHCSTCKCSFPACPKS
ncbi:hypothetical protein TWF192_005744 [Orbilia oligospora]|uniref:Uncharacterized protein n=1 Tax=Orbilia oligospora TaxID=2813651 RepID=A0A6G1MNP6_ORBOL|nr:hypothetical protein TWF191_003896 [Orbilia oligospora]KAF3263463.1 hypothetical protein TWF192_005744 [Orbilia oligospora]